jgi:UDP-glucose 4-epimerase
MHVRVLVTGGAGFIGSNVVDRLVREGHSVSVIDDLSTGFRENVNPAARFYEVDIRDAQAVAEVMRREKPEIVNHHAAQMDVRRSTREPVFDAEVNILGSLNLILAALEVGVRKFVYASTGGAVYGEPQYLPVDEKHPVVPISQYGISKHTVEHYLQLYSVNHGLRFTVLRYGNVYGPRQTPHGEAGVVAIFTGLMMEGKRPTIFGKGDKTRDYVYVDDVVEANMLAMWKGDGGIYNIGTGVPTTDQQVFETVRDAVGADVEPIYGEERLGEVHHIHLDASLAMKELGWKPTVTFAEGVRRAVDYYRRTLAKD